MTTYRIDVCPNGFRDYTETSSADLPALLAKLEAMKTASHNGGPVFLDDDVLEVVEVLNTPLEPETPDSVRTLLSWSRDGGEVYHEGGIVGWQLVDGEGVNLHGEYGDPFGLQSFEVLVGEAADVARAGQAAGGYRISPVRDGDVENPTTVEVLSLNPAPRP